MGQYDAIHLRVAEDVNQFIESLAEYLKESVDKYRVPSCLYYRDPNPWVTIDFPGFNEPDDFICEDLSRAFNTICIKIDVFTGTDSVRFIQFENGVKRRHISSGFGMEQYEWDTVEGEPLEWEEKVFFNPEELEEILNDEILEMEESEKESLRDMWKNRRIIKGEGYPCFRIEDVAKELKLSGFNWDNANGNSNYWTIEKEIGYDEQNPSETNPAENKIVTGILAGLVLILFATIKVFPKGSRIIGFLLILIYAINHSTFFLVTGIVLLLVGYLTKMKRNVKKVELNTKH